MLLEYVFARNNSPSTELVNLKLRAVMCLCVYICVFVFSSNEQRKGKGKVGPTQVPYIHH